MSRVPHLPQILQGPLAARPSAAQTPDWVWYFAWDDDGGAFWRATPEGWVKATPSVGTAPWSPVALADGWAPVADVPCEYRCHHGSVEFRGAARLTSGSLPAVMTTLREDVRPSYVMEVPVLADGSLATARLGNDGALVVMAPGEGEAGDGVTVRLDSLRFAR